MPVCIASGCGKRHTKASKIYMASFPSEKDPERRKLWIQNVFPDQPFRQPSIHYYVCEDHFEDHMWEKVRVDGKKKLKKNAVPTIFRRKKCHDSSIECFSQTNENGTASELKKPKILHIALIHSPVISNLTEASESDYTNEEVDDPSIVENETEALRKRLEKTEKILEEARNNVEVLNGTLGELKTKFEEELHKAKKVVHRLERSNIQLRKGKQRLLKKNKFLVDRLNRQNGLKTIVRKMLTEDQLEAFTRKASRGMRWSSETMTKALRLKFLCGTDGYEELRAQNIPLPSQRTLRKKLENIQLNGGTSDDIFSMLEKKNLHSQDERNIDCTQTDSHEH